MKSLNARAMSVIVPIALGFFGISTWFAYEGARQREIASSMQILTQDRVLAQQALQFRFDEIALAHQRARARMLDLLDSGEPPFPQFDRYFPLRGDGTRRSADGLWEGERLTLGKVQGFGAFVSDEDPDPERRRRLEAAFAALANFVDGLPDNVNNIYFFSPDNDLIMHAPMRADQLIFYRRDAPADLDFQDEEFSQIVAPDANPDAVMRCTSLQPILYDETRRTWTTGCMTPVRKDGEHLGAIGSSLPLGQIFRDDDLSASESVTRIIVSRDGKLIRHPDYTVQSSAATGDFLDLTTTEDPQLQELWRVLNAQDSAGFRGYLPKADIYLDARQLERPEWYVAAFMPGDKIRASAFRASQPILITGLIATALFALMIAVFMRRLLTGPIERLAKRADRISARQDLVPASEPAGGDELDRLAHAFDALESRVEQERVRLTRSFDRLVDAIEEYAILLLDPAGRVVRANGAAKQAFGWREDASLDQVVPPTDSEQTNGLLETVRKSGRVSRAARRKRGDGEEFWAFEAVEAIRDDEDAIAGFAYVARDMTGQKEAEAAIVAARDKARAELEARTNILAVMSHEIRTPLGGILGILDQLKRERSEAEREKALDLVEDSARVLLDTLDAILQQARIGQDAAEQRKESFGPGVLANRVGELFRPLARRKGIRIEVDAPLEAKAVGDPARMQQVLSNLVSNGVKFTQSGAVTIKVTAPSASGGEWVFAVSDTGTGMDERRLAGIFEPFGSSHADSLGRTVGTGLGLSITRDLVEAMGGTIEVESEPGSGTTFRVRVAFEQAPERQDVSEMHPSRGTIGLCIERASDRIQAEAIASQFGYTPEEMRVESLDAECAEMMIVDEAGLRAIDLAEWPEEVPLVIISDSVNLVRSEARTQGGGRIIRIPGTKIARSLGQLFEEGVDGFD